MKPIKDWGLEELDGIIGQDETSNLEFKRSTSLENTDPNKNELTKDVSAMANAAGGRIIYGMIEGGDKKTAIELDNGTEQTKEWIENVLTGNIEPRIQGIEIKRIPLASGKHAVVIDIPQAGALAPHQSKRDQKYYRRYNNTVLAMLDHEVRDLMRRGNSPDLAVRWDIDSAPSSVAGSYFLSAYMQNRSEVPATAAKVTLFFDQELIGNERVSPLWNWAPKTANAMSQAFPVSSYVYYHSIAYLPFFRGHDEDLITFTVQIKLHTTYWIGFEINSPGCNVREVGRVFRLAGKPWYETVTDQFTLE